MPRSSCGGFVQDVVSTAMKNMMVFCASIITFLLHVSDLSELGAPLATWELIIPVSFLLN
jgi:hypothetical protein